MPEKIEHQTIELNVQDLPAKYLALCEILADLSEVSIIEVNEAVDEYINSEHFQIEETTLPPQGELH